MHRQAWCRLILVVFLVGVFFAGQMVPPRSAQATPLCNCTDVTNKANYESDAIYELDNWDPAKPYIPFFNPNYPEWFLPISVPANCTIEFKFIKRDGSGYVIWEGVYNHSFTTPASGTADTPYYIWQN